MIVLISFTAALLCAQTQEKAVPDMKQWTADVRTRIGKDEELKRLAAKYPLVVLHSRHLFFGGTYGHSAYSFSHATSDPNKHENEVQLVFHNGDYPGWISINMLVGQQNLLVDLGKADFARDVDPTGISVDDKRVLSESTTAAEGRVYLERIRDTYGNNFYVLFRVISVDPGNRYMAFIWRRLPGGNVAKPREKQSSK